MTMFRICSIRDSKSESWMTPMFFHTDAQALRSFSDVVNGDTEFGKHPEDYTLFAVGMFDDELGEVVGFAPQSIALGANLVKGDSLR